MKEAPQAWEKYRARAKRLQGSFLLTFVLLPEKKVLLERKVEIKQRDGCALYLSQTLVSENKDLNGSVKAINPRYEFELSRKHPNKEWSVTGINTKPSDSRSYKSPKANVEMWSNAPFTWETISLSLPDIVNDAGFTLKHAIVVARDGDELAKVEFNFRAPEEKPRVPSITGWILFDPMRSWVMREYEVRLRYGSLPENDATTLAATYKYQEGVDGFPILKRIVRRLKRPAKSYEREDTYEFDLQEGDVAESEFTLSAFGFPDPKGMELPKPSRWYLWFIGGAVTSLALGLYLRSRLKRRKMKDDHVSPGSLKRTGP